MTRIRLFATVATIALMVLTLRAASGQSFIYVAATPDSIAAPYVLVIDATTLGVVTRIPLPANSGQRGMAIAPDGRHLYVLNTRGLTEIDLATHAVSRAIAADYSSGFGHLTVRNDGR